MNWKHFEMLRTNTVLGINNQNTVECRLEIGRLLTGRSRVNSGSYCRIDYEGNQIICEESTLWMSLHNAAAQLSKVGIKLPVYGLHPGFYESGLSADSGWGYVPNNPAPVLMISMFEKE